MKMQQEHRTTCRSRFVRWSKPLHKWVGVVFSIFIILFCFSGIVLNHRQAFSDMEVSRWWLPDQYHIENWNQGIVKGTIRLSDDKVLAYGQCGVWFTDRGFKRWAPLNDGIDEGIDNRKISNVVVTVDSTGIPTGVWCAALYDAYRLDLHNLKWQKVSLPGRYSSAFGLGNKERLSDITVRGRDTVVVASRSELYMAVAPSFEFRRVQIKAPAGYKSEVTLFKTVWMLHSGELFGIAGKLIVDLLAIVIMVLCITGIVFFILGYNHKLQNPILALHTCGRLMKENLHWHNRVGAATIILTVLLAVTGMCLRPPLMVPLVLNKTAPVPGSSMDTDNVFNDKIRAIRWDENLDRWLMSTSEGFFILNDKSSNSSGDLVWTTSPLNGDKGAIPTVSPMGINVFTRNPYNNKEWLIGSFSGLQRWNPQAGTVTEWFPDAPKASMIPTLNGYQTMGFSNDIDGSPVVFDYASAPKSNGVALPQMPEVLRSQPMSLWNFALELHAGRMYEPFLGNIMSILYVFISGLLLTLVLISGYILYKRK